jgi:hypothetical protein
VLALNYAILRFKTGPLLSSVTAAASGGGSTPTSSSSGHRHQMANATDDPAPGSTVTKWKNVLFGGSGYRAKWEVESGAPSNVAIYTGYESPNHTHTVSVPAHTHGMTYGLYADTVKPATVRIAVDGVDRTAELGGPWDAGGSGTEVEVDITTYLVNASGGLRQNHRIAISCDSGRGEVEAEVDMLVTIQPIAVV